jgi:tRNA A-37 threonylcarbamoyl transferase component Bud32
MHTGFDPAWISDREPQQVYKQDARSRVWRVSGDGGGSFVIKRFEFSPLRQVLGLAIGQHPGQREIRRARQLIASGLSVAPIIASGFQRRGPGGFYWLATPHLGTSLHNLFNQDHMADPDRRQRVLDAVGRLTSDLISMGLFNRDHKASNIVVDSEDRPWLIDVGAVGRSRGPAGADRMLTNLCDTLTQAGALDADIAQVRLASGVEAETATNR